MNDTKYRLRADLMLHCDVSEETAGKILDRLALDGLFGPLLDEDVRYCPRSLLDEEERAHEATRAKLEDAIDALRYALRLVDPKQSRLKDLTERLASCSA